MRNLRTVATYPKLCNPHWSYGIITCRRKKEAKKKKKFHHSFFGQRNKPPRGFRDFSQSPLPPLPPSPTPSTPPPPSAKASSSMTSYSPEDMLTEEEDEEASGIFDFPRERLSIVENLGNGTFGEIHLCEVDRFSGYDEVFKNTRSHLVVVKSLRPGSSEALRFVI